MHHKVTAFHYVWRNFIVYHMFLKTLLPVMKYDIIIDFLL